MRKSSSSSIEDTPELLPASVMRVMMKQEHSLIIFKLKEAEEPLYPLETRVALGGDFKRGGFAPPE